MSRKRRVGGSQSPQSREPSPGAPAVGAPLSLEITDLNHDGDGVGRTAEGFVVFVTGALPGERVQVRVETVKKRHAIASLESDADVDGKRVRWAPTRTQPRCAVAGECGGCRLQHFDYSAQLAWKTERVRAALERIGGLSAVEVKPIIGMDDPFHYRNKAQYPVQRGGDGRPLLGFYRRASHQIIPHDECAIQHPLIPPIAQVCRNAIEALDIPVYDEDQHTGDIRHVVVRASFHRNEALVVLVTRTDNLSHAETLIDRIRAEAPQVIGVVQNVNAARTNAVFGNASRTRWGESVLIERLGALEVEISATSFFQVNPRQSVRLYDTVVELADLSGGRVWDLYCGAGSIGLYVLQRGAATTLSVRGVDSVPSAIGDARRNAKRNGLEQGAQFEVGRAEAVVPRWVADGEQADVCLLDPPRSGCAPELLDAVRASGARRTVYVSCNPSTLARDLAILAKLGYHARLVQPVDMFPQTSHIETVALLERA